MNSEIRGLKLNPPPRRVETCVPLTLLLAVGCLVEIIGAFRAADVVDGSVIGNA